jgi:hypothetical protein
VTKLISLATDLNKVPSKRMTFTTMQTAADPANKDRVVPAAAAKQLFATIANDQSLSAADGAKKKSSSSSSSSSGSASAAPAVPAAQVAVHVENGTTTGGRASVVANGLLAKGFSSGTTSGNAPAPSAKTTVTYGPGQKGEAQTVASAIGLPASQLIQGSTAGVVLVIGGDWPSGTTFGSSGGSSAPADTHAAVADAHAQTADNAKGCAKVSPYRTVQINGVAMTPAQAYAASSGLKDSAQ